MTTLAVLSLQQWLKRGAELFGLDPLDWKFVCPSCKNVFSGRDWMDAGAPEGAIGFSCVGRWLKDTEDVGELGDTTKAACNYTGGGLFQLNPQPVETDEKTVYSFAFADGGEQC